MSEKVDALLELKEKQGGTLKNGDLKGLTDEQLHEFINRTIKGGITVKAAAYTSMKKFI